MTCIRLGGDVAYVLGGGAAGSPKDDEPLVMGNGRAIAMRLAEEGATVAISDISYESAAQTAHAIEQSGGRAVAFETDANDPDSCRQTVHKVAEMFGKIDAVVCNVGVNGNQRFRQQTIEDWEYSVAVNAKAHWVTAQTALEYMIQERRGAFLFVASFAAELSSGTSVAYEASKAAQLAVMRHIAARYGDRGVRSNALILGVIDTGMVRNLFSASEQSEAQRAGMSPMRRQGRPQEVAAAAAFLVSSDASYINGASLHVDGGLSAVSPSFRRAGEL